MILNNYELKEILYKNSDLLNEKDTKINYRSFLSNKQLPIKNIQINYNKACLE